MKRLLAAIRGWLHKQDWRRRDSGPPIWKNFDEDDDVL